MRAPLAISALGLAVTVALTGCTQPTDQGPGAGAAPPATTVRTADVDALLAPFGLTGASTRQVIDALEADPGARPLAIQASVRPDGVLVGEADRQAVLALPEDLFYVSVAPYLSTTHECFFHALGGCQGELPGEEVRVRITDGSGVVLLEETVTTGANGFAGFWLPRGVEGGTVRMTSDRGTGSIPLSTRADSPTCLTTLRLVPPR